MAVFCVIGGLIVSAIGVRAALWVRDILFLPHYTSSSFLQIASTGDIIYAGSLYLNSKNGTQWFLMLGA